MSGHEEARRMAEEIIRNDDEGFPHAYTHREVAPLARAFVASVGQVVELREALREVHEHKCGCGFPGRLGYCVAQPCVVFAVLSAAGTACPECGVAPGVLHKASCVFASQPGDSAAGTEAEQEPKEDGAGFARVVKSDRGH